MKISIFSDLHFGYGRNTEFENDPFDNAEEAISKSLDSDMILIPGDIFDRRIPTTNTWAKALRLFVEPSLVEKLDVKLVKTINKNLDEILKVPKGIPVIALHGTHERTGKHHTNSIQALEKTGFVIHLHLNGVIFEKGEQRVAIQGMSGVPERYAKQILDKWNPQPIKDCYNILMLHQSIEPYVYSPLDPPTLNISNLPRGFDLIINGHVHTRKQTRINGTTLLLPGSIIITQLKKEEAETPKGLYKLTIPENKLDFLPLEKSRKFFYKEIEFGKEKSMGECVKNELDRLLGEKYEKRPVIKIKIKGKKTEILDKELKRLEDEYKRKAILRFSKEIEDARIEEKIELLKMMRNEKISLEEMGMKLLQENLKKHRFERHFNSDHLFRILSDGQVEKAFDILTGKQETIRSILERSTERETRSKRWV